MVYNTIVTLGDLEINLDELAEAIVQGKKRGFASGNAPIKLPDGSEAFYSSFGNFDYYDQWRGSPQFQGITTVRWQKSTGQAIWQMVYSGGLTVLNKKTAEVDGKIVTPFLREALMRVSVHFPFRGPNSRYTPEFTAPSYEEGNLQYFNRVHGGDLKRFIGEEWINFKTRDNNVNDSRALFSLYYSGGLVVPKEGMKIRATYK